MLETLCIFSGLICIFFSLSPVPLVSRVCPSDVYRVWKSGKSWFSLSLIELDQKMPFLISDRLTVFKHLLAEIKYCILS